MAISSGTRDSIAEPRGKVRVVNSAGIKEISQAESDLRLCLEKSGYTVCPPDKCTGTEFKIELKLDPSENGLNPARAQMVAQKNGLSFRANSESGLNHVIYTYLNDNLGYRWVIPGDIGFCPPGAEHGIQAMAKEYTLPYLVATQQWGESPQWHTRMRRITDRQIEVFHIWHKIIPPDKYFSVHPEYFALIDGNRQPYQLCTSNRHVIDLFIDYYIKYFEKNPHLDAASISPEDYFNFCQCDKCRALDKVDGSLTDRLVYFFNKVIEGVNKKYPDKKLAFYAYLNYTAPPVQVTVNKNLMPVVCHTPWEFCHNHPIADKNCAANRKFREILSRWAEISPEVYVREYYGHFLWYGFWPILHAIEQDSAYFREIGIKGVISESHEHWGCAGWVLYGAGCYLAGSDKPYETLVNDYCKALYPVSSKQVSEFIIEMEKVTAGVPCRRMDLALTNKNIEKLYTLVDKIDTNGANLNEKELIGLIKNGIQVTKMLIKIKQRVSSGDFEKASDNSTELLNLIEKFSENKKIPPVIKYPLAKNIITMFRDKYETEKKRFYGKFNEAENEHFAPQLHPIKSWLSSPCYPDIYKQSRGIAMYPEFYERQRSLGLDHKFAPETESIHWEKKDFKEDFFTLSEYFPYRCDSIRYYKKDFKLDKNIKGSFFVRAIDGYKIILDGKEIAIAKERRFEKKNMIDFVDVDLSKGAHSVIIKLESPSAIELDDFTVILFDKKGNSIPLD